jgi:hypothetical protein
VGFWVFKHQQKIIVIGPRSVQKALFLQHLTQSGQAREFCEPALDETEVVGRELLFDVLPPVYRLWPKIDSKVRCVELIDLEKAPSRSSVVPLREGRTYLWAGTEAHMEDGIATVKELNGYVCSGLVLLGPCEDPSAAQNAKERTKDARVDVFSYNPEDTDDLIKSWNTDDEGVSVIALITESICRHCGPRMYAGGCSLS